MKAPTKTPISSANPPSIHLLRFSRALLPSAAASSPKIFAKQSCKHSGEKNKEGQSLQPLQTHSHTHNQSINASRNVLTEERAYWWGQLTDAAGLIILIDSIWSLLGHRGKSPFVGDLISTPTEPILNVCSAQLRERKKKLPSHVKWRRDSSTCDFGSWGFQINKVFFSFPPLYILHIDFYTYNLF